MKGRVIATAIGLLCAGSAHAYEVATHARLTEVAYFRSVLGNSEFLKQVGINAADPEPFGIVYYDVSGMEVKERERYAFERRFMPESALPLSVEGWLMRGAIREDDAYGEANPQDDPFNAKLRRPLHHFYDPIYDRPLSILGVGLLDSDIHTAPDWALGARNVFANPNSPETNRRNHFTVFDAREALFRALTGRDRAERVVAGTQAERNKYWATMFRALGDMVHMIQDMAQPQHTRNDQHAGKFPAFLTGHTSVYEKYVDARVTGGVYTLPSGQPVTPGALDYGSYPLPRFTDYASYFSTRHRQGDILARQGLADYSNRGFFSAGTNLGNLTYPYPVPAPSLYQRRELEVDWLGAPTGGKVAAAKPAPKVAKSAAPAKAEVKKPAPKKAAPKKVAKKVAPKKPMPKKAAKKAAPKKKAAAKKAKAKKTK